MPKAKPSGWKDELVSLVKEGKSYAESQQTLTDKFGSEGKVGVSTYGNLRKEFFPVEKREEILSEVGDEREKSKKKKLTKKLAPWSAGKQKIADESQLANVLNQVLFVVLPCPSRALEQKDLDEINLGGGVVAVFTYIFPKADLMNNPIVILVIRIGLTLVKVRKMCYNLKQKFKPPTPEEEESMRAFEMVDAAIETHPLDKPEIKQQWDIDVER